MSSTFPVSVLNGTCFSARRNSPCFGRCFAYQKLIKPNFSSDTICCVFYCKICTCLCFVCRWNNPLWCVSRCNKNYRLCERAISPVAFVHQSAGPISILYFTGSSDEKKFFPLRRRVDYEDVESEVGPGNKRIAKHRVEPTWTQFTSRRSNDWQAISRF